MSDDVNQFFLYEPYLFHICVDGTIYQCVREVQMMGILEACNSTHISGDGSCIRNIH